LVANGNDALRASQDHARIADVRGKMKRQATLSISDPCTLYDSRSATPESSLTGLRYQ